MVAKITTPHTILRALNYNEKKVQKGHAECIHAGNFLKEVSALNFYEKLNTFKNLIELNTRAKTNTLHISLNFDPSEKLSHEKLIEIASVYIQKIGFDKQPFLVYQHRDAGHPHIHILTTSIQLNGKRIDTFNIGRNQSEKARKEIEQCFGLIKAAGRNFRKAEGIEPINVQKIKYGFAETKRSIAAVLDAVITQYKYSSLHELNAVLKLYNVLADRGNTEGRIYRNKGLQYRILDEKGNKIGVPVKASSLYAKPTLQFLESRFTLNEKLRVADKQKLKNAIDWTLLKKPGSLQEFIAQLKQEKVNTILRQNEQGLIYGITFIDYRTKSVFNGSYLGKQYSVASIQKRITAGVNTKENPVTTLLQKSPFQKIKEDEKQENKEDKSKPENKSQKKPDLLELLMKNEKMDNRLPYELLKKKNKKRKPNW